MTSAATKILTFEEWANLPESNLHYEIVDGVMIMPPGATYFHVCVCVCVCVCS